MVVCLRKSSIHSTLRKDTDSVLSVAVHIKVNGETITCTTEHPFYIIDKGWVSANKLSIGDKVEQMGRSDAIVETIEYEKLEKPVSVYNFEVEEFHTYFVSESYALVHNDCNPDKPTDPKKLGSRDINRFDAHGFKEDFVGKTSISRFDIYNDRVNNKLWLGNKSYTVWHNTRMTLIEAITYYPKK